MTPNFPIDAYYQRFAYLPLAEYERAERLKPKVTFNIVEGLLDLPKANLINQK